MRHLRILTGLVAALAMVLVAFVSAPAHADREPDARAKPRHSFASLDAAKVKGTRSKFYVKGQILTYKGKKVKLQRSKHKKRGYHTFKQTRTNKKGKFRTTFTAPVGTHIRLVVPKTRHNRVTRVYLGKIVRAA